MQSLSNLPPGVSDRMIPGNWEKRSASPFKLLKTIRSHVGHARWIAECDWTDDGEDMVSLGFIARCQRANIPSPYAYSPSTELHRWNGKKVFLSETSHRCYQVFEVPANVKTFKTDEEATEYNIRMTRR
jgi:hypothetical protein